MRLTPFYEEADSGKSINIHVGFEGAEEGAPLSNGPVEGIDGSYAWSGNYSLESRIELCWWWSKAGSRVTLFALDRLATQRLVERQLTLEYPPNVDPLTVSGRLVADTAGQAALEMVLVDATTGQVHISTVVISRQGDEDIQMLEGDNTVTAQFTHQLKRAAVVRLDTPKVIVAAADTFGNMWRLVVNVDPTSDGSTDEDLLDLGNDGEGASRTASQDQEEDKSSGWTQFFRGGRNTDSTPSRDRSLSRSDPTTLAPGVRSMCAFPGMSAAVLVTYTDNTAVAYRSLDEDVHEEIDVTFDALSLHSDRALARVEPLPQCDTDYAAFWIVNGSYCVQIVNLCTNPDASYVMAPTQNGSPDSSTEFWAPHPNSVPRTITYSGLTQVEGSAVAHLLWATPMRYEGPAVTSVLGLATDVGATSNSDQLEDYTVNSFTFGTTNVRLSVPSRWAVVSQSNIGAIFHLTHSECGTAQTGQPVVCRADIATGSLGLSVVWTPTHPLAQAAGGSALRQLLHQPCALGEWGDFLGMPCMEVGTTSHVVALSPLGESASSFTDATVLRVLESSLDVIEAIPLGLREIKRMVHEAINTPLKAATLPRYTEIRLYGRKLAAPADISDADMEAVLQYVLSQVEEDFTSSLIPALSRRFVLGATLQEFADRATILLVAHAGWCSSNSTFATSPVLDKVRFAFQVLGGGLLTARSLGPWLPAISDSNSFRAVQSILNTFLGISQDQQGGATLVDLMRIGRLLTTQMPNENHAIRAVQRWVSVWASKFPLLYHYEVLAQIACGRTSGTSSAKLGHMISLLTAVVDRLHPSVLATGDLVSGLATDQDESLKELLQEMKKDAPNVYRAVILRHLVKRVDDVVSVSVADLSVITPNLLLPVKKLLQTLTVANGGPAVPPTTMMVSLQCLIDDVTVLQLGHAVAEQDIENATRLLLDLLKNPQNDRIVRHFTESLVNGLLAEEMGELLVDYAASNAALSHLISIELFQHVVRPKTTSTDRAERERKRESNTMVLYCFLVNCGALGTAARVMYEVGSSMRMAPCCTAMTLSYAHRALATAVETVRMIPTSLPPRTATDSAVDDNDDPFAAARTASGNNSILGSHHQEQSVYMEHRHYGGMEPLTRGDLDGLIKHEVQLQMELKLLVAARPIECVSFDRQEPAQIDFLVRELLQIRKFQDALRLAQVWDRDLAVCFNSHASELLEGHISSEVEQWNTLNRRIMAASGVHNNYKYLRTTISFVIGHSKSIRVHPSLPALLKRVDPSGLVSAYLAAPRVTKDVATNIFDIVSDYYAAKSDPQGQVAAMEKRGFSAKATITVTVLDRVVVLARSTLNKTTSGGQGAAVDGTPTKGTISIDRKAQEALSDLAYAVIQVSGASQA